MAALAVVKELGALFEILDRREQMAHKRGQRMRRLGCTRTAQQRWANSSSSAARVSSPRGHVTTLAQLESTSGVRGVNADASDGSAQDSPERKSRRIDGLA